MSLLLIGELLFKTCLNYVKKARALIQEGMPPAGTTYENR